MKKECNCVKKNPSSGAYFSNDSIRGKFVFEPKIPTKLSWISLELIGRISISFSSKGNAKNENGIYSASRILVNQNACVWRKCNSRNGNVDEFPAGSHSFEFSFWLPENSLPSFSSLHGNISYALKATLYNSKGIFKFCEMLISVSKPYDSMENPSLLMPKTISNLSLSIKPKLTVPRSIAIIGQPISLFIELENNSFDAIKSAVIGTVMRIIYKGKSNDFHPRETEKTVSKTLWKKEVPFYVSSNGYGIKEQKILAKVQTETINDSLIKINYSVFVKFLTKSKNVCSELSLPITFVKSLLATSNAPPPPYLKNLNSENENVGSHMSIHPPAYEDIMSS